MSGGGPIFVEPNRYLTSKARLFHRVEALEERVQKLENAKEEQTTEPKPVTRESLENNPWKPLFNCDGCGAGPASLSGPRFHCIECRDYDLCLNCFSRGTVHEKHTMIVFQQAQKSKNTPKFPTTPAPFRPPSVGVRPQRPGTEATFMSYPAVRSPYSGVPPAVGYGVGVGRQLSVGVPVPQRPHYHAGAQQSAPANSTSASASASSEELVPEPDLKRFRPSSIH